MSEFQLLNASASWVDKLAEIGFRDIDEMECTAASGLSAHEAALRGLEVSKRAWIGFYRHEPFCVFGFALFEPGIKIGIPWFLGTNTVEKAGKYMVKHGKDISDMMLLECEYLENYVHESNDKSIRWLKHLGFTIEKAKPFGVKQENFRKFHRGRDYV